MLDIILNIIIVIVVIGAVIHFSEGEVLRTERKGVWGVLEVVFKITLGIVLFLFIYGLVS